MKYILRILNLFAVTAAANCWLPLQKTDTYYLLAIIIPCFLLANINPSIADRRPSGFRLRVCADGCELLRIFLYSSLLTIGWHIYAAVRFFSSDRGTWIISAVIALCVEALVFFGGIARIYCTSVQLGIRWRVLGIALGLIPFVNLWILIKMILIADEEVAFESDKRRINENRREQQLCRTRYPILLVHGVCFRDFKLFNYWGRIPGELKKNGAMVFYGEHQSARAVENSAREIAERIKYIVNTTGCEKVNIIAHSKGGLDSRYAVSILDAAPYVASITTVSTPHKGCIYADHLLNGIPADVQNKVADRYNAIARRLGDIDPDFLAAMRDLTASSCTERNTIVADVPGIYYQSAGSILNRAAGGRFPNNISFPVVTHFEGSNDGLVAEPSFPWGERYECVRTDGKRGISHTDMTDLNRENIPGFDVREFYVELVSDLRERGL